MKSCGQHAFHVHTHPLAAFVEQCAKFNHSMRVDNYCIVPIPVHKQHTLIGTPTTRMTFDFKSVSFSSRPKGSVYHPPVQLDFSGAAAYCKNLSLGGLAGTWRLARPPRYVHALVVVGLFIHMILSWDSCVFFRNPCRQSAAIRTPRPPHRTTSPDDLHPPINGYTQFELALDSASPFFNPH
jgi:hypothetical protein